MQSQKKKLVIFDMNGVLVSTKNQLNEFFSSTPIAIANSSIYRVFPSIDLDLLGEFYNTHSFQIGIWTTAMKRNAEHVFPVINKLVGIQFNCFLTQEQCSIGALSESIKTIHCVKDLRVPSKLLNIALEDIMLIDDSLGKRCEEQNFHLYDPSKRDLARAIKAIDAFIGCTDETCCAKKII